MQRAHVAARTPHILKKPKNGAALRTFVREESDKSDGASNGAQEARIAWLHLHHDYLVLRLPEDCRQPLGICAALRTAPLRQLRRGLLVQDAPELVTSAHHL